MQLPAVYSNVWRTLCCSSLMFLVFGGLLIVIAIRYDANIVTKVVHNVRPYCVPMSLYNPAATSHCQPQYVPRQKL